MRVFCLCISQQVAEGARLFKGVFYVTLIVYILSSFTGHAPELWIIYAIYLVAVSRKRIAEEYGIPLNPVENICLAFFCSCCAATQVSGKPMCLECLRVLVHTSGEVIT